MLLTTVMITLILMLLLALPALYFQWIIPIFIRQICTYPHVLLFLAASVLFVYSLPYTCQIMADEEISGWVKFLMAWAILSAYMSLCLWTQQENAKIRNRRDEERDDS
ncbi:MAG: hypothetical protein Q4E67_02525 [Planctomycetia bacterium]|nr:hypothetical protein [Planctomycetia bacterium]